MEDQRFDRLTRDAAGSRRTVVRALLGALAAGFGARFGGQAALARRAPCRSTGAACDDGAECCSHSCCNGVCCDGTCVYGAAEAPACCPSGQVCRATYDRFGEQTHCCAEGQSCFDGLCCAPGMAQLGAACSVDIPCCGGDCDAGVCCLQDSHLCHADSDCCGGRCCNGTCCGANPDSRCTPNGCITCQAVGLACDEDTGCCSGRCDPVTHQCTCRLLNQHCRADAECCEGTCLHGRCTLPLPGSGG